MTPASTLRERSIRRLYHRGDPATSGMAAEGAMDSGAILTSRARVLAALRGNEGSTSCELAHVLYAEDEVEVGKVEVRRRLSDLKRLRLAVRGELKQCHEDEPRQCVWSLAPGGPAVVVEQGQGRWVL